MPTIHNRVHIKAQGYFQVSVIHKDGSADVYGGAGDKGIPNLIVNSGLDALSGQVHAPAIGGAGLATSNVPVAATDVNVPSLLGGSNILSGTPTTVYNTGTPPWTSTNVYTWVISPGTVVGNVSKVAILSGGLTSPTSPLFAAALISPGTITILSTDQVVITYTLVLRIPNTAQTGSFTLTTAGVGSTVNYSTTACGASSTYGRSVHSNGYLSYSNGYSTTYGATGFSLPASVGLLPTGTTDNQTGSGPAPTYTPGSFSLTVSSVFPVSQANYSGGIGALLTNWSQLAYFVTTFSPAIAKSNTQTLTIVSHLTWSN